MIQTGGGGVEKTIHFNSRSYAQQKLDEADTQDMKLAGGNIELKERIQRMGVNDYLKLVSDMQEK